MNPAEKSRKHLIIALVICGMWSILITPAFTDTYNSTPPMNSAEKALADQMNNVFRRASGLVRPAVVSLQITRKKVELNEFSHPELPPGLGSGCIIDRRGYIITNHHVVDTAKEITVVLEDGRRFKTGQYWSDPSTDLAVVKIKFESGEKPLPVAHFGDSEKAQVGDFVLAMGNPFGLTQTITLGIISYRGRHTGILGQWGYEDFIQTDAEINQGNSGGPLVNLYGEIIGINSNILSPNLARTSVGYGFAVPSSIAEYVAQQLIDKGKVRRGYLGVSLSSITIDEMKKLSDDLLKKIEISPEMIRNLPESTEGVMAMKVMPDTPAARAGIKKHDIFLKLNGRELKTSKQLRNFVARLGPDVKVQCHILRDGQSMEITIALADRTEAQERHAREQKEKNEKKLAEKKKQENSAKKKAVKKKTVLGIKITILSEEWADKFGYEPDKKSVVILDVAPDSIAMKNGLQPGDIIVSVNDKRIVNVEQLKKIISKTNLTKKAITIKIRNQKGEKSLEITTKEEEKKEKP